MNWKSLKQAPSIQHLDMQNEIDEICDREFIGSMFPKWAKIYFYRTRLNITPHQVAKMFDIDAVLVNSIAFEIGNRKPHKLKRIEDALMDKYPKYMLDRHRKHILTIANRIKQ